MSIELHPWTHICHLWVACDFPRKSKCDSRGPPQMFLNSYLSSINGICFFRKKQMWLLRGLCQCFWTHICHLWVACDFPGKSKCDSWGPPLMFLDSYLSSINGICFFRKKQMWLLRGLCQCFWTHICHLWVACDFPGKSKCDSWGPPLMFLDSYLSSINGICFFRKKQMWLQGASAGVSVVISVICEWHLLFRKSKCDSWWPHIYHL